MKVSLTEREKDLSKGCRKVRLEPKRENNGAIPRGASFPFVRQQCGNQVLEVCDVKS